MTKTDLDDACAQVRYHLHDQVWGKLHVPGQHVWLYIRNQVWDLVQAPVYDRVWGQVLVEYGWLYDEEWS